MKMITLLAALVAPALAYAQPSCGFRVDMAEALASNWGESLIASGMACMVDSGRALEVTPLGEPM